ncbi:hypothetical protein PENSPDRAFT_670025 [Peniophora sp. CONT]|nr:hypothetical protein PENSPDRAFT_670025 [Peniophora sp. CONT]
MAPGTQVAGDLAANVHELQARVNELEARNDELVAVNEGLQAQSGRNRGRPRKRVNAVEGDDDGTASGTLKPTKHVLHRLRAIGQAFAYIYIMLVDEDPDSPTSTFKQSLPENYNPTLDEQLKDRQSFNRMQTKRIIDELGPKLAPYRQTVDWVETEFMAQYTQQRSDIRSRVRVEARSQIFGGWAHHINSNRTVFKDVIGWTEHLIEDDEDKGPGYSAMDSAIIHDKNQMLVVDGPLGERQVFNPKTAFTSIMMRLTYAALFLGPQSAADWNDGLPLPRTSRMMNVLRCRFTTPEHIALCGTMIGPNETHAVAQLRWACSEDKDFIAIGNATHIRWLDHFFEYLKYLLLGLRDGRRHVLKIFTLFDKEFYPSSTAQGYGDGLDATEDKHMHGSALNNALAMLEAVDDEDDADDEEEDEDEDKPHHEGRSTPPAQTPAKEHPVSSSPEHPMSTLRQRGPDARKAPAGSAGPSSPDTASSSKRPTSSTTKRRREPEDDEDGRRPKQRKRSGSRDGESERERAQVSSGEGVKVASGEVDQDDSD